MNIPVFWAYNPWIDILKNVPRPAEKMPDRRRQGSGNTRERIADWIVKTEEDSGRKHNYPGSK